MNEVYRINSGHVGTARNAVSQAVIEPILSALTRDASRLQAVLRQTQVPDASRDHERAPVSGQDIDRIIRRRALRNRIFGLDLFSDPAWDLLLALYSPHLWQRRESIGAVTITSGLSATTALRWLTKLEKLGLVRLTADQLDGRRRFAELSGEGVKAMNEYFGDQNQSKPGA